MPLDTILLELILFNQKKKKDKQKKKINKLKNKINPKNIAAPLSALMQVLISSSIEKGKKTAKKEENKNKIEYEIKEERQIIFNGGYGTVSKAYGAAPVIKYTDYGRLFSHLGIFKANGMYELGEKEAQTKQAIESTREMVSTETMDKAAKHFKYFVGGEITGDVGYMPPVGLSVNSKDWEKYRLMTMMSVYRPLIKLKSVSA